MITKEDYVLLALMIISVLVVIAVAYHEDTIAKREAMILEYNKYR